MPVAAGTTLVRLKMSGTTLTTAGTYTASYNGSSVSMTAVQIMNFTDTAVKALVKNGQTLYTDSFNPGAAYDTATGYYCATSQGIHAKYLADTVYLAIYAKLSDGSYVYTKLVSYSPVTYAMNQLNYSGDTNLKQLVAAMLNYGAEAQLYFG